MSEQDWLGLRVLGIDYSTFGVDLVAVPYAGADLHEAVWRSVLLRTRSTSRQAGGQAAFRAALAVRDRLVGALDWSGIQLTYIEQPYSQNRQTLATLSLVQGAVIASLPLQVRQGAISQIATQDWKELLTGHAAASKEQVRARVEELGLERGLPQDACDAAGIAWAAREENHRASVRAEAVAKQYERSGQWPS
jgi:Holliday junction resolvasome RuvABC endonuclease subunit